jgi:ATP-dependent DNA ligase
MAKQPRLINPDCHRPVPWNEKAVRRVLATAGHVIAQIKEDGIRFHAFKHGPDVRVVTREGIEIRSLAKAKGALWALLSVLPDDFCVDGEVVVQGVTFEEGSGLLRAYAEIAHPVVFHVWDAFPLKGLLGDEYENPYADRLDTLIAAWVDAGEPMSPCIITSDVLSSMEEIDQFFETARSTGKEGAVIKDPELPLIHGKRTGQWKLKPSDTADGVVRGLVWGTPGLGNAGKIIGFTVELESGVLCDVTGITQAQMDAFTAEYLAWRGSTYPLGYQPPTPLLGRYVEIAYMEMTAAGSLRHPSFVQFRDMEYAPGWKS